MRKIKHIILIVATFIVTFSGLGIASASALSTHSDYIFASAGQGDACNGLNQVSGGSVGCGGDAGQQKVGGILSDMVSIISYVAGAIAIIMILISGIRYMTSGGDSTKVSAAKSALIYALIGIAVAGAAQILVHYVLSSAVGA